MISSTLYTNIHGPLQLPKCCCFQQYLHFYNNQFGTLSIGLLLSQHDRNGSPQLPIFYCFQWYLLFYGNLFVFAVFIPSSLCCNLLLLSASLAHVSVKFSKHSFLMIYQDNFFFLLIVNNGFILTPIFLTFLICHMESAWNSPDSLTKPLKGNFFICDEIVHYSQPC